MEKVYFPSYSEGEVQIRFEENNSKGFAEDFGKALGYGFIPSDGPWYLFKTNVGEEKEAMEKFLGYDKFVHGAERRDLRLEKRWEILGDLEFLVKEMDDLVMEGNFPEKINEIKKYIEEMGEDI